MNYLFLSFEWEAHVRGGNPKFYLVSNFKFYFRFEGDCNPGYITSLAPRLESIIAQGIWNIFLLTAGLLGSMRVFILSIVTLAMNFTNFEGLSQKIETIFSQLSWIPVLSNWLHSIGEGISLCQIYVHPWTPDPKPILIKV